MSIITLTTDFGLKDPFVGMMKGVIYSINDQANIVDISHEIKSQDIFAAAFIINNAFKYFPKETIHIVVVDPGVGTSRRPILVRTSGHYFIGPDNGALSLVIEEDNHSIIYEITEERYFLRSPGNTFHGRDIFAPVAGWLSKGGKPDNYGHIISDHIDIKAPKPVFNNGKLRGEIIYIDRFGNLFSNISNSDIEKLVRHSSGERPVISFNGRELLLNHCYAEAAPGETAAVINSFGLLEIYTYMGSAHVSFDAVVGNEVLVMN